MGWCVVTMRTMKYFLSRKNDHLFFQQCIAITQDLRGISIPAEAEVWR